MAVAHRELGGARSVSAGARARGALHRRIERRGADDARARRCARPDFAAAYAELALAHARDYVNRWSADPQQALCDCSDVANRALACDDLEPSAHFAAGVAHMWRKEHARATAEAEREIELDPNSAEGYGLLALVADYSGRPEEAIALFDKAMRFNPHYPGMVLHFYGHAHFMMGRYEEAAAIFPSANRARADDRREPSATGVGARPLGQDRRGPRGVARYAGDQPEVLARAPGQRASTRRSSSASARGWPRRAFQTEAEHPRCGGSPLALARLRGGVDSSATCPGWKSRSASFCNCIITKSRFMSSLLAAPVLP